MIKKGECGKCSFYLRAFFKRREGYPSKRVKVSSGLQANFTGRVTLSFPALLPCFVMHDILFKVQDLQFSLENTLNSRNNWKILLSYAENTLYYLDVYNLAQKLDNSVQIVKITGHS